MRAGSSARQSGHSREQAAEAATVRKTITPTEQQDAWITAQIAAGNYTNWIPAFAGKAQKGATQAGS